jgi:outer membrane protein assembly factor BamB
MRSRPASSLVRGAAAVLGLALAGGAFALDWTHFRFDEGHTGFNPFEQALSPQDVPTLELAWEAQLGKLVNYSSPAVAGDLVYIASSDGRLWAWKRDGCGRSLCLKPVWRSRPMGQIIDSPTVADGIVYIGSQTNDHSNNGKLDAFDAAGCGQAECAPLWQGDAGKDAILESSPTVAEGIVYVGAFDGRLYAFDAHGCGGASSCPPLWTGRTGGSIESTPLVAGGRVYVGSDDGRLHVFDAGGCGAASCRALWTGRLGSPVFSSSPAIVDGVVYAVSQHAVSAFDADGCGAAKCEPLWQAVDKTEFFNGSPAIANGHLYVGLETGVGVFAAGGCGHRRCDREWLLFGSGFQADVISSPTVANGVVYAGRNTGQLLAWSADPCGQAVCLELWSHLFDDPLLTSSPTVVDGRIYIGGIEAQAPEDRQGRLYVFGLPGQ